MSPTNPDQLERGIGWGCWCCLYLHECWVLSERRKQKWHSFLPVLL